MSVASDASRLFFRYYCGAMQFAARSQSSRVDHGRHGALEPVDHLLLNFSELGFVFREFGPDRIHDFLRGFSEENIIRELAF